MPCRRAGGGNAPSACRQKKTAPCETRCRLSRSTRPAGCRPRASHHQPSVGGT
ncbi:hypothetical protein C7S13_2264 [Burkholderia cepacia]|nr:hypothetical protein [Burkholderia cepacia]MDW9244806.1 hypothetical protein [Burkholderia cepacia]